MTEAASYTYSKRFICLWLLLLMAVATYIRVEGVSDFHYNEDESMIMGIAQAPSLDKVLKYSLYETHPPLLYILLHYWIKISDTTGFARSLSLVFGLALIPLYYRIGKLLEGEMTGMCCAALIAFSHGCIIQSYLVRHYTIMLLFLSLGFYYYLLWRTDRKNKTLILYTCFSALACLTHFSAIFTVVSLTIYEVMCMYKSNTSLFRNYLHWLTANAVMGSIFLITYFIWRNTLTSEYVSYTSMNINNIVAFFFTIAVFLIILSQYIFPGSYFLLAFILLVLTVMVRRNKKFDSLFFIILIPLFIAIALAFANIYPSAGRHGLWLLPFMILPVGQLVAKGAQELNTKIAEKWHINALPAIAFTILIIGCCSYNPEQRFSEDEYTTKEKNWEEMLHYMMTLGKNTLIITVRDNIFLLESPYPYLENNASGEKPMANIIAYKDTHILFNPYYRRIITPDVFIKTLQEAQQRGVFNEVNTILIMKTTWDQWPRDWPLFAHLFTCHALDKKIVSFPEFSFADLPPGTVVSDEEKKLSPIAFMIASKKNFFEQLIVPSGKAHSCLEP